MGRFFLFALLTWITGNPLLAVLVIVALSLPGWWAGSRWAYRFSRQIRAWGEAGRLRRALALNPHDAKARVDLGGILTRQKRFREARVELEQALPRADDLPETHYFLGLCLMNDGEAERGRAFVERALAINPKFGYGEPYLRLGDFHASRAEWGWRRIGIARPPTSTVPAWRGGASSARHSMRWGGRAKREQPSKRPSRPIAPPPGIGAPTIAPGSAEPPASCAGRPRVAVCLPTGLAAVRVV